MRYAMHAASQLPGRGPTVRMMPLHLHVNQKSDYDDGDDQKYMLTTEMLQVNRMKFREQCSTVKCV